MSARRVDPRVLDPITHPRRFVTLQAAARYLEIDRTTLNKYLDEGLLASVRYNGRRRLEVAEVVAFERRARRRDTPRPR